MFIIGLTGGVASGKTTATNYFLNKGIEIIDADEISRSLQIKGAEGYRKIIDKFGRKILNDTLKLWDLDYEEKKSLTSKDSFLLNIKNMQKKI